MATKNIGPGSYEAPAMAAMLQKNMSSRQGAVGSVFGSTSRRFAKASNPQPTPGPGEYGADSVLAPSKITTNADVPKGQVLGKDTTRQSATFVSQTARLDEKAKKLPEGPEPGAYHVAPRWDQAPGVPRISAGGKRFQQSDQTSATTDVFDIRPLLPTFLLPFRRTDR